MNAAAGKASAAISKLASDVKVPAQPLGAVSGVVTWALGEYLNELRLEQLQKIVAQADPIIASASQLLSQDTVLLRNNIVVQKAALLQQEQSVLFDMRAKPSPDEAVVMTEANAVVADATALQSFADTDVKQPFVAMRTAHAALLASLNDPQVSPDEVFQAIDGFVQQVASLKAALDQTTTTK